jgi:hypothetical protein
MENDRPKFFVQYRELLNPSEAPNNPNGLLIPYRNWDSFLLRLGFRFQMDALGQKTAISPFCSKHLPYFLMALVLSFLFPPDRDASHVR